MYVSIGLRCVSVGLLCECWLWCMSVGLLVYVLGYWSGVGGGGGRAFFFFFFNFLSLKSFLFFLFFPPFMCYKVDIQGSAK